MSLIKQPYEIRTDNITLRALIYGQPGIGKSTLALSMPAPVLIDADGGVRRIAPHHRVPTLQVGSFQEVLDVVSSKELAPFETIVIDTAGKLLDYVNVHVIKQDPKNGKRDGGLTMQGWGARAYAFDCLVKLISVKGKHLIFVAHEREEKDGDIKVVRPDFGGGKAGGELIKDLDLVGYMEAIGKRRTISFMPCEKYYAKNAARIDDVLEVPTLEAGMENNFLSSIVTRCMEAMTEETEQMKGYNILVNELLQHVTEISNAETANAATKVVLKASHIWDSKERLWTAIRDKASVLGLSYDKKGGFVNPVKEAV